MCVCLGDGQGHYGRLVLATGNVTKYDSFDGAPYIDNITNGQVSCRAPASCPTPTTIIYSPHRVTVTEFCSISMPVDFCRHLVGKTLINVCHCDSA